MPSSNYAYVNGRFVLEAEATVSIFDRGFLYGDGVFETMRVYDGKIFRLYQHLQRLLHGLKVLEIGSKIGQEELRAILLNLVERNSLNDGMARIYVTRGPNDSAVKGQEPWQPTVVAMAKRRSTASMDLRAVISSIRLDASSKLQGIKSANRLSYEIAQHEARNAGFSDALLLNGAGRAIEFTTSNVFVVKNGELFTPPLGDGPLPGITRDLVLTIAAKLGIPTYELSFGTEMFSGADEVFATNSLMEIEPVREVDGAYFQEHHVIMRLQTAYREFVQEELQVS
jgi:branched-chain amino acid aminotransferase